MKGGGGPENKDPPKDISFHASKALHFQGDGLPLDVYRSQVVIPLLDAETWQDGCLQKRMQGLPPGTKIPDPKMFLSKKAGDYYYSRGKISLCSVISI